MGRLKEPNVWMSFLMSTMITRWEHVGFIDWHENPVKNEQAYWLFDDIALTE